MKPTELIKRRNGLCESIKKNWLRIALNNVVPEGKVRNYDVEALYKVIIEESALLIAIKVAIQAVNMGLSKVKDLPENSLYPIIYSLQQLKEQKVKLLGVPTDKPNAVFSKAKIAELVRELDVEIDSLSKAIEEYNNNTEFDIAA